MQNEERNTELVLYRNVEFQDNLEERGPFEMSGNWRPQEPREQPSRIWISDGNWLLYSQGVNHPLCQICGANNWLVLSWSLISLIDRLGWPTAPAWPTWPILTLVLRCYQLSLQAQLLMRLTDYRALKGENEKLGGWGGLVWFEFLVETINALKRAIKNITCWNSEVGVMRTE